MTRRLLAAVSSEREPAPSRRGRLLLECLEGRQMLAGDVELFATAGTLVEPPTNDALETSSQLDSSSLVGEGEAAPDLVGFATALKDAGVVFYGAAWCPFCTEQEELFEDGAAALPFVEVTNPDRTLNQVGIDNNIQTFPTWEFPDATRATGVLSLEEISQRSGVAIPTSETPSFAPIGPQSVRIGSPLHLGVDAYDPNGDPLTVTVSVDNPELLEAVVLQGNRSLQMDIKGYGNMVFELFEQRAPRPSGRVIDLANAGFYDDIQFHRVIDNFVLQAGDPTATGSGGSDLGDFDDQFHPDLQHTSTGVLSFAKSADDTNDSQFFITEGATQHLDFNHSIFGQLVEGDRIREAISETEVDSSDKPTNDVVIDTFTVFDDQENSLIMLKPTGNGTGTANVTITVSDSTGQSSSEVVPVTIGEDVSNAPPYLEDIDPIVSSAGTPATIPLQAVDIEGDPVEYLAEVADQSGATVSIDQSTGDVTVTPPANFSGQVAVNVGVRPDPSVSGAAQGQIDTQALTVAFAEAAPTAVELIDASDSGSSQTDDLTNVASMTFQVSGVSTGATVELLIDDAVVGIGTATSSTVAITTNNVATLGDGTYSIRARQRGSDGVNSPLSPPVELTYDSTSPVAVTTPVPTRANAGSPFAADLEHPEEGSGLTYALTNGPAGVTVDPSTGELAWTPTTDQIGDQTITLTLTDAAGNTRAQSFDVTVAEEVIAEIGLGLTDLNGNALNEVQAGDEFLLTFSAKDARGISAQGVFAAFADVAFDSSLVEPVGNAPISYSNGFTAPSGTIGTGVIDELGAVSSSTVPTNSSEALIATIRMQALAVGQATFTSDQAEGSGTDLLLYSRDDAVPEASIGFGAVALTIAAPYSATDDNLTVAEDSTENEVDVLTNDQASAGAGTTLSLVSVGTPSHGQATLSNGEIVYTPAPDFFGVDSFTYVVEDQNGSTQTATVNVTVTGVNDPPTAADDTFQVATDSGATSLDLLANDTDAPDSGETLTITAVGSTSNGGTVSIATDGSSVSYTPAAGFTGTDSFTYTVSDGTTTNTATVNVAVGQTNAPPTAVNDAFTLAEDSFDPANDPAADAEYDVLANDSTSDSGETISLRSVGNSANGATVRLSDDGSKLFYVPAADFFGTDTVSYTIVDSEGAEATANVTFTVTPVNDPPPAGAITQTVLTGAAEVTVATGDDLGTNVDGDEAVTFTELGTTSAGGTAQIASDGESVRYTPPSDTFTGTDTFTYTVTDASGATATGEVTLQVREYVPRSFTVSLDGPEVGSLGQLPGVILRGTTDFGETVETTGSFSSSDGTLTFADLAPGDYEIEVPAMPFLAGGEAPQVFSIDSNAEDGNLDDLVAKVGPLLPRYVSIRDYLITTPSQTILAAVETGQSSVWVAPSKNLQDLSNPRLSLNDDGSAFELEITDANDQLQQAVIPLDETEAVDLREEVEGVRLVRINVSPDVVTYSPGISSTAASTQPEGEAASSGTPLAPLSVNMPGEGEDAGQGTRQGSAADLARLANRRTAALDAAYADVADQTHRPTTAETLLEESDSPSVDGDAIDAFVSLLADRDRS